MQLIISFLLCPLSYEVEKKIFIYIIYFKDDQLDIYTYIYLLSAIQNKYHMVILGGTLKDTTGVGLGCMSVSGQYNNGVPLSKDDAFNFFKGVYDNGCRHFDTAEVYTSFNMVNGEKQFGGVYNESQLGDFFSRSKARRGSFTVGTKFHPLAHKTTYDEVKKALLDSLKRLQLSYVDLYYTHRVISKEQACEFATICAKLKKEGLIKNYGLSETSKEWLQSAHEISPVCAIQQEWSLLTRELEEDLVPYCRDNNIGIIAYSPLARNLLAIPSDSERPTDARRQGIPRFSEEHFEKNRRMIAQLEELSSKKNVSTAQLSMAWLLQKGKDLNVSVLPIPGTATLSHALDNLSSSKITLNQEDMKLLENIAEMKSGNRESDQYMEMALEGVARKSKL